MTSFARYTTLDEGILIESSKPAKIEPLNISDDFDPSYALEYAVKLSQSSEDDEYGLSSGDVKWIRNYVGGLEAVFDACSPTKNIILKSLSPALKGRQVGKITWRVIEPHLENPSLTKFLEHPIMAPEITGDVAPPVVRELGAKTTHNLRVGNRELRKLGLSEADQQALITMVDPFHDERYKPTPPPDGAGDVSIVEVVRRSLTITNPAPGAPWDCNISILPMNNIDRLVDGQMAGNNVYSNAPVGYTNPRVTGPVTCVSVPTGEATWPTDRLTQAFPPSNTVWQALGPVTVTKDTAQTGWDTDNSFLTGRHRILDISFEVANTTAVIEKGGAFTTYRLNQKVYPTTMGLDIVSNAPGGVATNPEYFFTGNTYTMPPANLPEVAIDPNAVSVPASQGGVYVSGTLAREPCIQMPVARPFIGQVKDQKPGNTTTLQVSTGYQMCTVSGDWRFPSDPNLPSWTIRTFPATTYNDMNLSGVFCSGLPDDTTLFVTAKFTVQRFPTEENELLVLSDPVPPRNPHFWDIYTEIAREQPSGFPIQWNFLGKWFKKAMNTAKELLPVATPVIKALGPKGAAVGSVLDQIAAHDDAKAAQEQHDASNDRRIALGKAPRRQPKRRKGQVERDDHLRKIMELINEFQQRYG